MDELGEVCSELGLSEEECNRIRDVVGRVCGIGRVKRAPSEYNRFIGKCVRSETGPVTERFRRCVEKWKRGER